MKYTEIEAELLPSVMSLTSDFITKNGFCAVTTELPTGYRIVDIVIAAFSIKSERLMTSILGPKLRLLTLHNLMVLERIVACRQITTRKLAKELYIEQDILENRHLSLLEKLGLVIREGKLSYKTTEWIDLCPKKIISIEMKLYKWREALDQAKYNLYAADQSYIALPEESIQRFRTDLGIVERSGVGLITINQHGVAQIEIDARDNSSKYNRDKGLQRLRILRDLILADTRWEIIS
jgi:hypothetical protein